MPVSKCERKELENYHFAFTNDITDSDKDHQWILMPLRERYFGQQYHSTNCKGKDLVNLTISLTKWSDSSSLTVGKIEFMFPLQREHRRFTMLLLNYLYKKKFNHELMKDFRQFSVHRTWISVLVCSLQSLFSYIWCTSLVSLLIVPFV